MKNFDSHSSSQMSEDPSWAIENSSSNFSESDSSFDSNLFHPKIVHNDVMPFPGVNEAAKASPPLKSSSSYAGEQKVVQFFTPSENEDEKASNDIDGNDEDGDNLEKTFGIALSLSQALNLPDTNVNDQAEEGFESENDEDANMDSDEDSNSDPQESDFDPYQNQYP